MHIPCTMNLFREHLLALDSKKALFIYTGPGYFSLTYNYPLTSHHNVEYSETFHDSYRPGIVCKNAAFCPEIFSSVPIRGVFCDRKCVI